MAGPKKEEVEEVKVNSWVAAVAASGTSQAGCSSGFLLVNLPRSHPHPHPHPLFETVVRTSLSTLCRRQQPYVLRLVLSLTILSGLKHLTGCPGNRSVSAARTRCTSKKQLAKQATHFEKHRGCKQSEAADHSCTAQQELGH